MKHKLPDLLFFLIKDICHDWARTALTVFGMALVIFSFFILNAFSQSLSFFTQSVPVGSNLIVIQSDLIDPSDSILSQSALEAAEQMPTELVSRVSPVLFRHLRINDQMVQLRGALVEDWESVFHMQLLQGDWPEDAHEITVGEGTAKANNWKIGSRVEIFGSGFTISAITRIPGSAFASIWMPLEQARLLFGKNDYQMMVVQTAKNADAENVRSQLQANLQLSGNYSVFFEDTYSRRNNQIFKDMSSLMSISANLALLAVTFGTYTSTNLSLTERGREIGILRAIGFPHEQLGRLLRFRAILQGIPAFFIGLVGAMVFIGYHRAYSQLFVLGFNVSFEITWQVICGGFILTTLLALIGAWLSSRRLLLQDVNHLLKD